MAPRHRAAVRPAPSAGWMGALVFLVAPLLAAMLVLLSLPAGTMPQTTGHLCWYAVAGADVAPIPCP
jgi:hypothetical protein